MDWFKIVSTNYKDKFYTIDQVKIFVDKGKINEQDFEKITGQKYTAGGN